MKSIGAQFLGVLALSSGLGVFAFLLSYFVEANIIHDQFWGILIFSAAVAFLVTWINHYFMTHGSTLGMTKIFLLNTMIRMILSLIFITIFLAIGLENQLVWIANFFIVYLFYLTFEIYVIMSNLRAISNEGEKNDQID